eukprot:CAMPEP_0177602796 /NCGR_PEP_ID=MMETSP0419_2-20121207/15102_1 /TAXON_ID=582737 /ORGANISM="Tetraselmis sp., Strain GSL018" /LENGTH=210 /DNA_ID=CAMNT_0019096389 /DNA_START=439 /DNA_END=1071 /DNA_ORIENTATION=-
MQTICHPHIVKFREYFEDELGFYIVMEKASGKNLLETLIQRDDRKLSEPEVCCIAKQLLDVLGYLEERRIAHRDLKLENIVLNGTDVSDIKVVDFGLAAQCSEHLIQRCGTFCYAAPEILSEKSQQGYNASCDLWSLGMVLFELLGGQNPLQNNEVDQVFDAIRREGFDLSSAPLTDVSEAAKDFLGKLLVVDPEERLSISCAMAHPWVL